MRTLFKQVILLVAASCATVSGQPQWDCLFDGTFEEATAIDGRQRIILVLADTRTDYDYWDRWALATPETAEWVSKRGFRVVFEDISQNTTVSFLTQPAVLPAVIVFDLQGREVGRRYGFRSSDTAEVFTEWADSLFGVPLHIALASELEQDTADISLRFRLIDELGRAGLVSEQFEQFAWLLDRNDIWASYAADQFSDKQPKADDSAFERDFRTTLLSFAGSFREKIGYLARDGYEHPDGSGYVSAISGWDAALSLVDSDPAPWSEADTERRACIAPIVWLRRSLEARRDAGMLTDRDRFVLTALTGSKDEWQALYDSVRSRPGTKSPSD